MHGVPRTNAVFRQIWHTRLLDFPILAPPHAAEVKCNRHGGHHADEMRDSQGVSSARASAR